MESIQKNLQESNYDTVDQMWNLYNKKNCANKSITNPVILYPVTSLIILALSSFLTILKLETFNIIMLPFKLITGLIMILFLTVLLVLICNFFSDTTTWISTIIFILITAVGAPLLIYLGVIFLTVILALGITGTTISCVIYTLRDKIKGWIYGTPEERVTKAANTVEENIMANQTEQNMTEANNNADVTININDDKIVASGLNNDANVSATNETTTTSEMTAGTINSQVPTNIST
mgnify:CR=1 FL=1